MVRVDESKTDLLKPGKADSSISDKTGLNPTLGPPLSLGGVGEGKEFAFLGPPDEAGDIGRMAHYRVLKVLGKGGMGMVFEAIDIHLQRSIALKVMRPEMGNNQELRQRFLREARATAAIKSDYIVTIHQVGQENDVPYLAMEYLQGKPLDRWLAEKGAPTIREALRLGIEIAKGLAAAHERGLIHRDIKPSNIWIEEPTGRVKILDFGLARATQDEMRLTQTGLVMGTPEYMAPEQAEGTKVDERSDLYSLGCVIYELLTGNPPFTGPSVMSILRAVATEDAAPVRKLNPEVPADLAKIVMRLLAKSPDDRYSSAAEVVQDLEELSVSPATRLSASHRPSGVRKASARRGGRRRWLGVLAGAAVVVAVGGYFVWHGLLSGGGPAHARATFRGVTNNEIQLGISAPFEGPAKELGREMETGINTYLRQVNEQGGIHGRKLTLIALDDGYDPDRALVNMQELYEQRKVFGVIGNVGTPTAEKTVPYAMEKELLFFGGFTGSKMLRESPPKRYVFNYRASYEEETAAIVKYLLRNKRIKPEQIAVFAQQDGYGDAGFNGVKRELRELNREPEQILRVGYDRKTGRVNEAVKTIIEHPEVRAVVMVASYRPAAQFIQKVKERRKDLLFTNVSFVGTEALASELIQGDPENARGVIVTQVVPPPDSSASIALKYREHLRKFYPQRMPTFTSLEGYIDAAILCEGIRRTGSNLTTEALVDALESMRDYDIGLGAPINYGKSDHQALNKVWATVLDEKGKYQMLDLDE